MKIKARVIGCTVLGLGGLGLGLLWRNFDWQDFSSGNSHLGQNNRQLKLHTLIFSTNSIMLSIWQTRGKKSVEKGTN